MEIGSIDMVESEPMPIGIDVSSEDSTSLACELGENFGPAVESSAAEILRAAQHFSQKD